MKRLIPFFVCAILSLRAYSQPPSWETAIDLGNLSVTSMASDGYGQHLVGVTGGVAKHYLYGNDGVLIYNTLSVSGGEYPVVTSYGGKVRVTMKVGNEVRIYQSTNGGSSWPTTFSYTPSPNTIHHIDAYSDQRGTHITWDSDANCDWDNEIYYVRYNDGTSRFEDFKNVSDLASPSLGFRPKVTATSDEAHVVFFSDYPSVLTSRDLYIPTGTWEGTYKQLSGDTPMQEFLSTAAIGDSIYAVGWTDPLIPFLAFTRRHKTGEWIEAEGIGQAGLYCPDYGPIKELVASGGKLHLATYESSYGVTYNTYTPGSWWAVGGEVVVAPSSTIKRNSILVSASQVGAYVAWFDDYPGLPKRYVRRKPFSITGTISARTFLTGNNWFSGGSAAIGGGVTVDGRSGSTTTFLNGSTLSNSGTFTALSGATVTMNTASALIQTGNFTINAGATMNIQAGCLALFGSAKWLTVNGSLNAIGTSGSPINFSSTSASPYPGCWASVKLAGGPNTMEYCNI